MNPDARPCFVCGAEDASNCAHEPGMDFIDWLAENEPQRLAKWLRRALVRAVVAEDPDGPVAAARAALAGSVGGTPND